MFGFLSARTSLGDLQAEVAADVLTVAADVTLVLDSAGVVRDLAFGGEDLASVFEGRPSWVGRPWVETVTEDSRPKVAEMVQDAAERSGGRWRQVNQRATRGSSVPVLCAATRLGRKDRIIVFGRDLRPVATLQQRLVDAQQALQREYARVRHAEARHRLLFQISSEPLLVVDAATQRVTEANLAADRLATIANILAQGATFLDLFAEADRPRLQAMLAAVQSTGRAEDVPAHLAATGRAVSVSVTMTRQDSAALFVVRLAFTAAEAGVGGLPASRAHLLRLAENVPDAFVVADTDGTVRAANAAFLELAQVATEEQARGAQLSRWLGRSGVELDVLLANLRQRRQVRLFASTMRGEHGAIAEVEISAVTVVDGGTAAYGLAIRDVGARTNATAKVPPRGVPRSVEQLTELVGRVPLKELVREATDVIERLAIEAALTLTSDNRASAAEMLGLSRQSLYVKLRRYGLGDLETEGVN